MEKTARASVLLVDDNTHTLASIARLLDRSGFHVLTASTADEALEILTQGIMSPSFVILDQVLDGRRDGGTQAAKRIADLRQDIFIVMYTADPKIDQVEKWRAIHAGAHRFILKGSAEELLADFNEVIDDMHDLRGLTREIAEISRGRLSMFSALVGLDARLTIVDKEYRVWFSTDTEAKEAGEVGGLASPCWLFFHGFPVEAGPCAGCSINAAIDTGEMRSRIFLARSRRGELNWVRNDTIPVFISQEGGGRRVIAAREACQLLGDAISDLTLEQKCRYAAESIIQAGFTSARIYRAIDDGQIKCVAAATCQPPEEDKVYLEKVVGFAFSLERNRYMTKAVNEKSGTINLDWDPLIGPDAEAVFQFNLSPPWIDLPLWQEDNLVGWVGADLKEDVKSDEAENALLDLKDYGAELVRACFGRRSTDSGPTLSRPILELARRELNRAQDASEAIVAIMQLARSLVEEHSSVRDVRIRVREDGRLRIINRLSPDSRVVEAEIFEDDPESWAAFVVRFRHPLYVDNRLEYAERVSRERNLPQGKFLDGGAIAILPLEIQGFCFGSLHIECTAPFDWARYDLEEPLGELAGVIAILVRDIVVNRQLAEAKSAVERELRDAFGNLHGVRGPIQIVRNAFESILESHERGNLDGDTITEIVQDGRRATSRIERLARQLLRLSGSASRATTRLGLLCVLREFISEWRQEDIVLALEEAYIADVDEVWIEGNVQNLREIFEEIMANAAQARAKIVTVRPYSSGADVVVNFTDNGVGIDADKEEKIFERWYTEFPEGNGLGLTLVKTIVDHMGGRVWAESSEAGLSLNLQLPIKEWVQ